MAHRASSSTGQRGEQQGHIGCVGTVCHERDLDAVGTPHARMHDERVAQCERLTWLDDRRTDGGIRWSTALQHRHFGRDGEFDRPRARVDELEAALGLHVERYPAEVYARCPGDESTCLRPLSRRRRGGCRARATDYGQHAERADGSDKTLEIRREAHTVPDHVAPYYEWQHAAAPHPLG